MNLEFLTHFNLQKYKNARRHRCIYECVISNVGHLTLMSPRKTGVLKEDHVFFSSIMLLIVYVDFAMTFITVKSSSSFVMNGEAMIGVQCLECGSSCFGYCGMVNFIFFTA